MGHKHFYLSIILAFLGLASCSEGDCVSLNSNMLRVKFDSLTPSGQIVDKYKVFDAIYAIGEDGEFLLTEEDSLTRFLLPLYPGGSALTIVFKRGNLEETLELSYKSISRFISDECGVEFIYSNLAISNSSFDSVSVINDRLRRSNEDNIKILELE